MFVITMYFEGLKEDWFCQLGHPRKIKNLLTYLLTSFLIGSSSYLQITRTTIISRTSSKLDQIRPRTAKLAALERLKISHRLIMGKILLAL